MYFCLEREEKRKPKTIKKHCSSPVIEPAHQNFPHQLLSTQFALPTYPTQLYLLCSTLPTSNQANIDPICLRLLRCQKYLKKNIATKNCSQNFHKKTYLFSCCQSGSNQENQAEIFRGCSRRVLRWVFRRHSSPGRSQNKKWSNSVKKCELDLF